LAGALSAVNDRAEAGELLDAVNLNNSIAMVDLVNVMAHAVSLDHAERLANRLTDVTLQTMAFANLAVRAIRAHDRTLGERFLHRSESLVSQRQGDDRMWTYMAVAEAITAVGEPDRAQRFLHDVTADDDRADAFVRLASIFASAGHFDRAERLMSDNLTRTSQHSTLVEVAKSVSRMDLVAGGP
jgi:hypothetical protein